MPVQDNSPTKKSVRWYDIRFVYRGMSYKIKDDFSNKKYIYWSLDKPNIFQGSDNIPINSVLVYINNDGLVTTYPIDDGVFIDNSARSDNSLLINHMSDTTIHLTENFIDLVERISIKLENAILRIEELEKV